MARCARKYILWEVPLSEPDIRMKPTHNSIHHFDYSPSPNCMNDFCESLGNQSKSNQSN